MCVSMRGGLGGGTALYSLWGLARGCHKPPSESLCFARSQREKQLQGDPEKGPWNLLQPHLSQGASNPKESENASRWEEPSKLGQEGDRVCYNMEAMMRWPAGDTGPGGTGCGQHRMRHTSAVARKNTHGTETLCPPPFTPRPSLEPTQTPTP